MFYKPQWQLWLAASLTHNPTCSITYKLLWSHILPKRYKYNPSYQMTHCVSLDIHVLCCISRMLNVLIPSVTADSSINKQRSQLLWSVLYRRGKSETKHAEILYLFQLKIQHTDVKTFLTFPFMQETRWIKPVASVLKSKRYRNSNGMKYQEV